MLKNYNQYILNEKKDVKAEKSEIEEKIMKLFKDKPEIKATSDGWPDSKGIYSLAGIKKYVGAKDNLKVDQVFNDMRDNEKIKFIKIKINSLGETYPYFYHEDHTSKEEAEKCKETMEKSQKPAEKKPKAKAPEPKKRAPRKKAEVKKDGVKTEEKPKAEKKPVTEKDLKAKAKATIRRKKA